MLKYFKIFFAQTNIACVKFNDKSFASTDQRQGFDEGEVDDVEDEACEVADERKQDQRLPAEFVRQGWKGKQTG